MQQSWAARVRRERVTFSRDSLFLELDPANGARGQVHIRNVKDFCSATYGFLYVLTRGAVRRIDPRSGEVMTWLQKRRRRDAA